MNKNIAILQPCIIIFQMQTGTGKQIFNRNIDILIKYDTTTEDLYNIAYNKISEQYGQDIIILNVVKIKREYDR